MQDCGVAQDAKSFGHRSLFSGSGTGSGSHGQPLVHDPANFPEDGAAAVYIRLQYIIHTSKWVPQLSYSATVQ